MYRMGFLLDQGDYITTAHRIGTNGPNVKTSRQAGAEFLAPGDDPVDLRTAPAQIPGKELSKQGRAPGNFFPPASYGGPAAAYGIESASCTQGFTGAFQDNALDVGVLPGPGTEVPFVMG
jgi:hypothetical protein